MKLIKKIASYFQKDENGQINRPMCVLIMGIFLLPIIIFEGIKVGFYDKFSLSTNIGISTFATGLSTSFIKIMKMESKNAFANTKSYNISYLLLMLAFHFSIFAIMYISAERMKNKSANKDGDMKFGKISDYNKEMAYPIGKEEVEEPKIPTASKPGNMILSDKLRYSLSGTPFTYSCALIIGSIGSNKTYKYVKPNIMQMNASFVITDPKLELLHDLGQMLSDNGYDILVFNLKKGDQKYSCRYNPFAYIRDEQDVILTVDSFLDATSGEGTGGDPFFPIAEKNFYYALFYYVFTVLPKEEQTLKQVYELYSDADEEEKSGSEAKRAKAIESNFDKKFMEVARKDPYNPSLPFYKTFKKGSPKTKQSILISVGIKLWFLSVPETANLLSGDDLHFNTIGERKTALFVAMPVDNDSFKCISAMLFTQLFQELYYQGETLNSRTYLIRKGMYTAGRSSEFIEGGESEKRAYDELKQRQANFQKAEVYYEDDIKEDFPELKKKLSTPIDAKLGIYPYPLYIVCDRKDLDKEKATIYETFRSKSAAENYLDAGRTGTIERVEKSLAVRTRFILDEFYAIGKITGFESKIATFRSLKISADIICQNVQQLKDMYEDKEEKITGNCDIRICLGVNTMTDAKMFSDMVGQTTVRSESVNLNHKGLIQSSDGGSLSDNAQMLIRPEWLLNQMKGEDCLILTRTMLPIKDKKYNPTLKHPMWKYTYDEMNKDSYKNAYPFRRIFLIEQKPESRIKTMFEKETEAQSVVPQVATNITRRNPLDDDDRRRLYEENRKLYEDRCRLSDRQLSDNDRKRQKDDFNKDIAQQLENLRHMQINKRDMARDDGHVEYEKLSENEQRRVKNAVENGKLTKDNDEIKSPTLDEGDIFSLLTDKSTE